jgi:hypothetical protein
LATDDNLFTTILLDLSVRQKELPGAIGVESRAKVRPAGYMVALK